MCIYEIRVEEKENLPWRTEFFKCFLSQQFSYSDEITAYNEGQRRK